MYLAIDTSTETASLALVQGDEVLAELTWRSQQNHTRQLLVYLSHLLKQTGLELKSATGIIVAKGPGSFNGLRVGISIAKGFAFSLGIPIVAVSTLEAEAYQQAETGLPICPIFNAGRGEIATARYQKKSGRWRQLAEERITTIDALCSEITAKTVFCGEFVSVVADKLREHLGAKAVILSSAARLRRAGFLAELGRKRLERGDYDDPTTLQASYLRGPSITERKRR